MSTSQSVDAEEEAARPPRMTRGAVIAMWSAAAVSLAIAAWIGWGFADQPVRWRAVGFDISSPTEATATFDVFFYSEGDATCRVRALNSRHAEVGAIDVLVERDGGAEQRVTASVATIEVATTAVVAYCVPVTD